MSSNAFTSLANLRLHLPGRLFSNSCCPDKDLVLLFTRFGGTDRMSLWNSNQGSKIWETDVGDGNENCHVSGIAWSPDGQSIAIIQNPPSISLHSLQDGSPFLSLPISLPPGEGVSALAGIWWFKDEKDSAYSNIPDIFKRGDTIAGSALSVLKILPLLDSLQEENERLTATDLFAFQGSHTRTNHKTELPAVIETWPTLSPDSLAASINPSSHNKTSSDSALLDEVDNSNLNSILLVADSSGRLFSYLDGTFPLGYVSLGLNVSFSPSAKHPAAPFFLGQPHITYEQITRTTMNYMQLDFPLLAQRKSRDLANLSSTARELTWYVLRVAKEMREAWCGTDSNTGARELGPKWVSTLESKQREQFGQSETNPILDLTYLLTTGRSSEALSDFLGSGEQMSERGIQKWESTVTEALIKLRDSAEKRMAPALQRIHLILNEILGWSKLSQFTSFNLPSEDVAISLELASRGIIIASWLAAVSRTELTRFKEFVLWLRFEVNAINSPNDGNVPRHDILEVNNYFVSGLAGSVIDEWFTGPVPQFKPADLGLKDYGNDLVKDACEHALKIARDPSQVAWQTGVPRADLSHIGKNIEALVQELAQRSQRLFHNAAGAIARSAVVSFDSELKSVRVPEKELPSEEPLAFPFRERTVFDDARNLVQHSIAPIPSENKRTIFLTRLQLVEITGGRTPKLPDGIDVALLECYLPEEDEEECDFHILNAEFFDDECVVIVYRLCQGQKQTYIATLDYNLVDEGYQRMSYEKYVKGSDREDLMQDALELWKDGQLTTTKVSIGRRRALAGCKTGGVSLALNGRVGRRVACVLDNTGTTLESFDLEGDAEDMEVADDAKAG